MTWVDYVVFGVMGLSVAWGLWRGLVREVISLAGWVIAFLAANLLAGPVGERLPESFARPELRVLAAFVAIFVATLIVATLVAILLSKLLKAVGLGSLDRLLGALFGVARGLLVVLVLALLAGLTRLPGDAAWKASLCSPALAEAALKVKPWLPPAFAERLRYH